MQEQTLQNKDSHIKEAIFGTVAFFDMFDYPLTSWEIWKLGRWRVPVSLAEVLTFLDQTKDIEHDDGYYFLPGRGKIIQTRKERYNFSDVKFKRALRISRLFKFFPWIKLIAVSNLIGDHNMRENSDIDLFIVTQNNRIWLTRFLCVLLIKSLGLRPKPKKTKNTICLSFFITENSLDLKSYQMQNDIYFTYWLAGLTPIYNPYGTYEQLIEQNAWLKEKLINWQPLLPSNRRDIGPALSVFYNRIIENIFGWLEKPLKQFQLKKMPAELKQLMNQDTRVVINDNVLKMHSNDRRAEYNLKLKTKIDKMHVR